MACRSVNERGFLLPGGGCPIDNPATSGFSNAQVLSKHFVCRIMRASCHARRDYYFPKRNRTMARWQRAIWMPLPWNGGGHVAGVPYKIVHHTTEGSTAQGAFETYQQTNSIPHFTVDATQIYQHLDTGIAARALRHDDGTVETN